MNQKGKTLLELLVSLAIMGVLSISVLFGLKAVWIRHRSNQILSDTTLMFSQMLSLEYPTNQIYHPDFVPESGHQLVGWKNPTAEDVFAVKVFEISFNECERILRMDSLIIRSVTVGEVEMEECVDGVDMTFVTANDLVPKTENEEAEEEEEQQQNQEDKTEVFACDWGSSCCTNGVRFRWWGRWYCRRRWIPWWWK